MKKFLILTIMLCTYLSDHAQYSPLQTAEHNVTYTHQTIASYPPYKREKYHYLFLYDLLNKTKRIVIIDEQQQQTIVDALRAYRDLLEIKIKRILIGQISYEEYAITQEQVMVLIANFVRLLSILQTTNPDRIIQYSNAMINLKGQLVIYQEKFLQNNATLIGPDTLKYCHAIVQSSCILDNMSVATASAPATPNVFASTDSSLPPQKHMWIFKIT